MISQVAAGLLVFLAFVSADRRFCLNSHKLEKPRLCRDSCTMYGIDQRTNTASRARLRCPGDAVYRVRVPPCSSGHAEASVCCSPRQALQTGRHEPDFPSPESQLKAHIPSSKPIYFQLKATLPSVKLLGEGRKLRTWQRWKDATLWAGASYFRALYVPPSLMLVVKFNQRINRNTSSHSGAESMIVRSRPHNWWRGSGSLRLLSSPAAEPLPASSGIPDPFLPVT